MKNKKLLGLGVGVVICICLAGGFMIHSNNNEAVETMAMGEQKEEEILETPPLEAVENVDEKEQEEAGEAVEPKEETLEMPTLETEKSVDKTEKEKETESTTEPEPSSGTNDEDARSEEEIILEAIENEESTPAPSYEIIPLESTTMYATQASNIRSGPSTEYERVGGLSYGEAVTITGKVENEGKVWYVIDNEEIQMVSGSLLSDTKPQPQVQQATNNTSTPEATQPVVDTPPVNSAGSLADLPGAAGIRGPLNIEWGVTKGDGILTEEQRERASQIQWE